MLRHPAPRAPRHFSLDDGPEPHAARTRAILAAHPEVRELIGRNPWSAVVILAVVSMQLSIAWLLRAQPWWQILAVAWLVGAFANHAMYVMIHEAAHQLIFRKRWLNNLFGIIADIPNVVPAAISFRTYHLKHHAYQGVYELDADLPHHWEARLIGGWAPTKALWLLLFPLFQVTRPPRMQDTAFLTGWTFINWVVVFAVDAAVWTLLGPKAFAYLLASFFFSIGLHPLGARWIQEHFLTAPPQETYSYYGPLNLVAFNVGYHNEHHDFPSVPWNRLPEVRRRAPEFYDSLVWHKSWTGLWLRWMFDRELSLFSRMLRPREAARAQSSSARQAST
ncbi:MAG: fatty acid desaturase [Candidatus Dadabacteria bacterium]|nr:MAG: fatty acid desaturase [Candidatus Dadabacteria bacterium]